MLLSCAHSPESESIQAMRQAISLELREQERHDLVVDRVKEGRVRDDPETRWEREAELDIFSIDKSMALGRDRTMHEGYRVVGIMKKKNIDKSRALQLLIDQANKEGIMNWMMIVLEVYGIPPEWLSSELGGEGVISPFVRLGGDS